jgi:hypothetical protein
VFISVKIIYKKIDFIFGYCGIAFDYLEVLLNKPGKDKGKYTLEQPS